MRGKSGMYLQMLLVIFAFAVMVATSYVFMSRNEYAHLKKAEQVALDMRFIDMSKITEYTFNLSISEDSYGILLDSMLNILVHPNKEFLGKSLHDIGFDGAIIFDVISTGEAYISELIFTNYIGEQSVLSATRLENGWYLGIITPETTYYSGIRYIAIVLIVIGASMSLILCVILTRLTADRDKAFHKIREQNRTIVESINYASKIQKNLLPQTDYIARVFSDHCIIWKPRDVVGGDVYWMKQFDTGTVLCVADCTGHGAPGALLTMLVVSALEAIVWPSNCDDTAGTIQRLDQRLSAVLHHAKSGDGIGSGIIEIDDGCDIAVLFIAKDNSVQFSSGKIPIFVCDGTEVIRYKGQKIFVGEGKLTGKDEVAVYNIPANPNNKFYIASDGMFDQVGGEYGRQFGYKMFTQIILENHNEKQAMITGKVWDAFEEYRGDEERRDDFELIAFKP